MSRNGLSIQYIDNLSEEIQIEAVRRDGLVIQYINNPSEKVQLEAVRMSGAAIKYIDRPSKYIKSIVDKIETSKKYVYVLHEPDKKPFFSTGCHRNMTKEYFIQRMDEEDRRLKCNLYRQEYLDIINRY